jgi:hypothetical protein
VSLVYQLFKIWFKKNQKSISNDTKPTTQNYRARIHHGILHPPTPQTDNRVPGITHPRRAEKVRGFTLRIRRFVDVFDEHFCKEKIESNRVTAGWENGDTFTAGKDRATLEGYEVVEVYVTDERARVWVTDWIARDGAADGCEDWREAHASVHAGVLGRVG